MHDLGRSVAKMLLYGFALFGIAAMFQLNLTGEFWAGSLPLCMAVGAFCARTSAARAAPESTNVGDSIDHSTPRWLLPLAITVIAAVGVALAYGAWSTPARHWDGYVAWELKARFLARTPSIDQPFFSAPGVYAHTADYPLLQPLAIAAAARLSPGDAYAMAVGRLFFPLTWLALLLLTGSVVRQHCRRQNLGILSAAAVAVIPALVNPTMGGVDSGFADAPFALGVAAITAAMLTRDRWLFAAALAYAALLKPEGAVFGALALAISWARCERDLLRYGTLGFGVAMGLWLPLQRQLIDPAATETSGAWTWLYVIGLASALLISDALFERAAVRARIRTLIMLVGAPLLALALPLCVSMTSDRAGTFDVYLDDLSRPLERLSRLPAILGHLLQRSVFRFRFGCTFLLPAIAIVLYAVRRRSGRRALSPQLWTAGAFVVVGYASIIAPFLLSPEANLEHHVKSSMTRLLLHWSGAAWIVGVCVASTSANDAADTTPQLSASR